MSDVEVWEEDVDDECIERKEEMNENDFPFKIYDNGQVTRRQGLVVDNPRVMSRATDDVREGRLRKENV